MQTCYNIVTLLQVLEMCLEVPKAGEQTLHII